MMRNKHSGLSGEKRRKKEDSRTRSIARATKTSKEQVQPDGIKLELLLIMEEKSDQRGGEEEEELKKSWKERGLLKHPPFSKYDLIKIFVKLGEHSYLFSRLLLSRFLTSIQIPQRQAAKMALILKKKLADQGVHELTQNDLESHLFSLLRQNGFGDDTFKKYRIVFNFFAKRVPLLLLVSGPPCSGLSSLVSVLAERLNLSNILQLSSLEILVKSIIPEAFKNTKQTQTTVLEFQEKAKTLRRGVTFDMKKCISDGKPLIIEGTYLVDCLYIEEGLRIRVDDQGVMHPEASEAEKEMYMELKKALKKTELKPLVLSFLIQPSEEFLRNCIAMKYKEKNADIRTQKLKESLKIKKILDEVQNLSVKVKLQNWEDALDTMHSCVLGQIAKYDLD